MIKKLTTQSILITLALSIGSVQAKPKEKVSLLKSQHTCTSKDSPQNALACAIYFEARSDGPKGMLYVGNVILNRRGHNDYPDKVAKVVYQKHQFSYISKRGMKVYDKKSWKEATDVAKKLLSTSEEKRRLHDPSRGAIFFIKKGRKPYWSRKMIKTTSYKSHIFYREKSK